MPKKDIFNSATVDSMLRTPNLKWHTNPPDVIPMWIAAPDFPIAPEIKQGLRDAVEAEDVFYNTRRQACTVVPLACTRIRRSPTGPSSPAS